MTQPGSNEHTRAARATDTAGGTASEAAGACLRYRRRAWLLSALCGPLERCARDRTRLLELLALADRELLAAVGGRRRAELADAYERYEAPPAPALEGRPQSSCRHREEYPRALLGSGAPHMLEVAGGVEQLARLTAAPVVALVGSRAPSDYGIEMAGSLARGLVASGVSVLASLDAGIAAAAHLGALEVPLPPTGTMRGRCGGPSIAVTGGGLDVCCPARLQSLYARVRSSGCAIAELPSRCDGMRWGQLAAERTLAALADVTVVVEADDTPGDLAPARIAQKLDKTVAALPGRVTSPLSRGAHALLLDGAKLVRGPGDVLELLHLPGARGQPPHATPAASGSRAPHSGLRLDLRAIFERVGAGYDTPDRLARAGTNAEEILHALSELELIGLLTRGEGGRYVPRDAAH